MGPAVRATMIVLALDESLGSEGVGEDGEDRRTHSAAALVGRMGRPLRDLGRHLLLVGAILLLHFDESGPWNGHFRMIRSFLTRR